MKGAGVGVGGRVELAIDQINQREEGRRKVDAQKQRILRQLDWRDRESESWYGKEEGVVWLTVYYTN